ncbi:hypothetical protein AAC387_Pa07g1793 [Persea americana]
MATSLFILMLLLLLQLFPVKSQNPPAAAALYVFGDSLSDSGNNNNRLTTARANYPPYGVDFVGGTTGRFTNGKTFVDFAAEALGLPYVPAYFSLSRQQRAKTGTGVNYASGSAGILNKTGRRLGRCVTLREQIKKFRMTVRRDLPKMFPGPLLSDHLSRSIFFVSVGSNDYINNYLQPDYYYKRRRRPTPQAFAQTLVDALQKHMQRLHYLGARKIVMFDIGPIGCIPNNTNATPMRGQCVEEINNFVVEFNNRFFPLVQRLNATLRGSNFVPGLTYPISQNIYTNAPSFGKLSVLLRLTFTNVPCCPTYSDGIGPCKPEQQPCPDRGKHMYWDSYHPTEVTNSLMASACFWQTPSQCFPPDTKIQQLARR